MWVDAEKHFWEVFGDTLHQSSEGSEFTDLVPNYFTICMNPDEIDSLLENSEANIDIF
jgi:hypothetical protein